MLQHCYNTEKSTSKYSLVFIVINEFQTKWPRKPYFLFLHISQTQFQNCSRKNKTDVFLWETN